MILASLMSCGTASSFQHWQRTSCKGGEGVILSLPGAFLEAKLLMALLSSSVVGSVSSSSMTVRHSMASRATVITTFCLGKRSEWYSTHLSVIEFLSSPLMDPNSNEYFTNPANIYVRNSKPPKNTILIDLKINKNHMFKYITCSEKRDVHVTEFKVLESQN